MIRLNNKYLYDFIFDQKCIPWKIYEKIYKFRNIFFNINTKKHWDSVWLKEKDKPDIHRLYQQAYKKIVSLVNPKQKIIDIGCGIGILLTKLKEEKNCEVLGIDVSEEGIKAVMNKNILGFIAKVPPIPVPSDSFDVAIATELLEHISKPEKLIKEMFRILKPMGTLIISTPDNALHPYVEREHLRAFNEINLGKILGKFKDIHRLDVFKVKEENEKFYRLILKVEKCQK